MTLPSPSLPPHNLRNAQHQTNRHNHRAKRNARIARPRLPRPPLRQIHKAQRRENVGERAGGRGADELEDDADVAGDEGDGHGGDDERGGEDEVAVGLVRLVGEVVFGHDFAADEAFEGEGGEHV